MAIQLFTKVGGDLEMFLEDRHSAFVQEAFLTDQQIAHEMQITCHPSAVIYNYGAIAMRASESKVVIRSTIF